MGSSVRFQQFLLAMYIVLMLRYKYIIVIYDGVCKEYMLNILCGHLLLTLMKKWLT